MGHFCVSKNGEENCKQDNCSETKSRVTLVWCS
jgi:hypothetical protein